MNGRTNEGWTHRRDGGHRGLDEIDIYELSSRYFSNQGNEIHSIILIFFNPNQGGIFGRSIGLGGIESAHRTF